MNRLSRLAASLALLLAIPGLAPYQAAAQVFTAAPAAASAGISGVSAAAVAGARGGTSVGVLPVSAPTTLSAAPLAASLSGPAAALNAAAAAPKLSLTPAPLVKDVRATVGVAGREAANESAPTVAQTLETGAAKVASAETGATSAQLDALFEGAVAKPAADASVADAESMALRPLAAASSGPRRVFQSRPSAPQVPRTSLKRTLAVGYLTGFVGMALTQIGAIAASVLGWVPHANYKLPFDTSHLTLGTAGLVLIGASVLAPLAEEVLFRGGLQGGLSKLTKRLNLGDFLIPALITSAIFVVVHETADPVMIGLRFMFAFMLSRTYKKEGILASMAAHGAFNGLTFLPLLIGALHSPLLAIAALPLTGYMAWRAYQTLKAQKPEIASGALAPRPFTVKAALLSIPILVGGFLFVMPNSIWLLGAIALVAWLAAKALGAGVRSLRG